MSRDVYIAAALRTPVGKAPRGALRSVRADDLLVHVLAGVLARCPGVDPAAIGDVVIGCAMPEGEQGMNIARIALLLAGLPHAVPGVTVNRFCASGLEAIAIAAARIRAGELEIALAGGVESMSRVPMLGHRPSFNPQVTDQTEHFAIAYGMGITAERVAERWQIDRAQQDSFALESHRRAVAAQDQGLFADEILPLEITQRAADLTSGETMIAKSVIRHDEGPRRDTSMEALAALKPAFAARGSVTPGNSSQRSDGAAILLLASAAALTRHALTPLARFVGYAVAGVAPEIMGIGPVAALPQLARHTGVPLDAVDWSELNEAFAAQSLAVINELRLDAARVNPFGGAIALGHPLGATGAIRSATLVHGLARRRARYGVVTMCIGTGMGAAGLFENMCA